MLSPGSPAAGDAGHSRGHPLTYDDVGDPAGTPVLYFHGGGDSRLTRHPDDSIAASLGIRLVSVDRSGPAVPGRTLVTWARDVEGLADELGLGRFAVLGWSAGGPHALAVAGVLTDRVTRAAIVGSMPPPDATNLVHRDVRLSLRVSRLAPGFAARRLEAWGRKPTPSTGSPETDEAYARGRVDSFRAGGRWLVQELAVLGRPWGFDLAAITAPVTLWWGRDDAVCRPPIAEIYAERIPQTTVRIVDGSHQALFTSWREILDDLRS